MSTCEVCGGPLVQQHGGGCPDSHCSEYRFHRNRARVTRKKSEREESEQRMREIDGILRKRQERHL